MSLILNRTQSPTTSSGLVRSFLEEILHTKTLEELNLKAEAALSYFAFDQYSLWIPAKDESGQRVWEIEIFKANNGWGEYFISREDYVKNNPWRDVGDVVVPTSWDIATLHKFAPNQIQKNLLGDAYAAGFRRGYTIPYHKKEIKDQFIFNIHSMDQTGAASALIFANALCQAISQQYLNIQLQGYLRTLSEIEVRSLELRSRGEDISRIAQDIGVAPEEAWLYLDSAREKLKAQSITQACELYSYLQPQHVS